MFKHYVWASSVRFTVRVSRHTSNSSESTTAHKKMGIYMYIYSFYVFYYLSSFRKLFNIIQGYLNNSSVYCIVRPKMKIDFLA